MAAAATAAAGMRADDAPRSRGGLMYDCPQRWQMERVSPQRVLGRWLQPRSVKFRDDAVRGVVSVRSRPHRRRRHPHVSATNVVAPRARLIGLNFGSVSYWTSFTFLVGSIVFSACGALIIWPLPNEAASERVVGWASFAAALLYELGAYTAVLEAINVPWRAEFGHVLIAEAEEIALNLRHAAAPRDVRSLERLYSSLPTDEVNDRTKAPMLVPHERYHRFTRSRRKPGESDGGGSIGDDDDVLQKWRWWAFEWRSLGFLAASIQLIGATLFVVSIVFALPGVVAAVPWQVTQALYWFPEIVGSMLFVTASFLFYLEEAHSPWWQLWKQWNRLGCVLSVWNIIGSFGFLFTGLFGSPSAWPGVGCGWCALASGIADLVGSLAFTIGSYLEIVEAINPHPVSFAEFLRALVTPRGARRLRAERVPRRARVGRNGGEHS